MTTNNQNHLDSTIPQGQRSFNDLLCNSLNGYENRLGGSALGLSASWPSLRKYIHGFKPGELIIVASQPSIGKTSFILNMILDMAINQKASILMFSLAMKAEQIVDNLCCIECKMDGIQWRNPTGVITDREQVRIMNGIERLSKTKIVIDDNSVLNPTRLREAALNMKQEQGLDAIFIDSLQFMNDDFGMRSTYDDQYQENFNISRQLKIIAKEFNVPVFAVAQLKQNIDSRAEKVPRISDLSDGGSLEQNADVVILLHRPEVFSPDKNNPIRPGEADIIISKNRNGDVGKVGILFIKNRMTFCEKDRDETMNSDPEKIIAANEKKSHKSALKR